LSAAMPDSQAANKSNNLQQSLNSPCEADMRWTSERIFEEVRRLLEPYNAGGIDIGLDTDLSSELNMDSVAAMDLVMEIEDRFEIDFPINNLPDVGQPSDLVRLIQAELSKTQQNEDQEGVGE
jgi:acyl carrier protein